MTEREGPRWSKRPEEVRDVVEAIPSDFSLRPSLEAHQSEPTQFADIERRGRSLRRQGMIMRASWSTLTGGFILMSLLLVACGDDTPAGDAAGKGGGSIAGNYGCGLEDNPDAPVMGWELRQDGTLVNHSPPDIVALGTTAEEKIVSGTWAVTGSSGTITSENQVYPFVIEQDRLVFRDGKFVCRPAPSQSPGG